MFISNKKTAFQLSVLHHRWGGEGSRFRSLCCFVCSSTLPLYHILLFLCVSCLVDSERSPVNHVTTPPRSLRVGVCHHVLKGNSLPPAPPEGGVSVTLSLRSSASVFLFGFGFPVSVCPPHPSPRSRAAPWVFHPCSPGRVSQKACRKVAQNISKKKSGKHTPTLLFQPRQRPCLVCSCIFCVKAHVNSSKKKSHAHDTPAMYAQLFRFESAGLAPACAFIFFAQIFWP